MSEQLIKDLGAHDPRKRFRAVTDLRHNYDPIVGSALVSLLFREKEAGVWWLVAQTVLPIWLPMFDQTALEVGEWRFNGIQTIRLLELSKGHVLHSAGEHVEKWIVTADWAFRFAGFRWLTVGGSADRACFVANQLLSELQSDAGSFSPPPTDDPVQLRFFDVRARIQELGEFIQECC